MVSRIVEKFRIPFQGPFRRVLQRFATTDFFQFSRKALRTVVFPLENSTSRKSVFFDSTSKPSKLSFPIGKVKVAGIAFCVFGETRRDLHFSPGNSSNLASRARARNCGNQFGAAIVSPLALFQKFFRNSTSEKSRSPTKTHSKWR